MANITFLLLDQKGQYMISCPHCAAERKVRYHITDGALEEESTMALTFKSLEDAIIWTERIRKSSIYKIVTAGRVVNREGFVPRVQNSYCSHIPDMAVRANKDVFFRHKLKLVSSENS